MEPIQLVDKFNSLNFMNSEHWNMMSNRNDLCSIVDTFANECIENANDGKKEENIENSKINWYKLIS